MRLLVIMAAVLFFTACGDTTLDTSSDKAQRDSYNAILESLPENDRQEFDDLVVYYFEEYEKGGSVYQNDINDLDGLNADEIYTIVKEHKATMDKIRQEEMAAYNEYQDHKANNPEQFQDADYLKLSTSIDHSFGITTTLLHIQSLVDNLEIRSITVNRGNCAVRKTRIERTEFTVKEVPTLPVSIKFGERRDFALKSGCNLLGVEVTTDKGTAVYTFE